MGEWRFDRTINFGNLLTILIMVGALLSMYNGIIHRMDLMQTKVDLMWDRFTIVVKAND